MELAEILAPLAVLIAIVAISIVAQGNVIACTRDGAILALEHIREWAKWMTGIESAALGALGLLAFNFQRGPFAHAAVFWAWLAFSFLGLALVVSGWSLSALSSLAIRIHRAPRARHALPEFDVLEQPIFGRRSPRLGTVVTIHHFLWASGLFSLGVFVLLAFFLSGVE